MILFHGSNVNVTEIDLKQSKVGKDFGCGFYLTPIFEHALRQANRKTEQSLSGSPIVSKFDFDDSVLNSKVLCTKVFDGYSEEWADFILLNRQNRTHDLLHSFDIVVGPIADDTIGYQIRRYLGNIISKEQFINEIKYIRELSIQYFFATQRSLNYLKPL